MKRVSHLIYTPKDFQDEFLKNYDSLTQRYNLRGYLLAGTAGSGKTYNTLLLAECLNARRVVIFCQKNSINRVWEAEVNKLFRTPQTYWIADEGKPYRGERFLIVHYEAMTKLKQMTAVIKDPSLMVILDESHNLNEIDSQRTPLFLDLCSALNASDIVFASGTPLKAMGSEAIPLLKAIDPYFDDDAQQRFKGIFGRDGNRGLDILKHRLGLLTYKVEKHQLGLEKPDMRLMKVTIPNGKEYTLPAIKRDMEAFIKERFAYYKKREKEDIAFYEECLELHRKTLTKQKDIEALNHYRQQVKLVQRYKGDARMAGEAIKATNRFEKSVIIPSLPQDKRNRFKDIKSIVKYVNLKIQGEALGRVLGRKRVECHMDMVPHVDFRGVIESTTKKTVIFTSFVEALEKMEKELTTQGFNPTAVYGKTNNDLAKILKEFETNEDINPLTATYQSLSTAVPLVMADTMLLLNAPFRDYIQQQAISRIHRLGATTQCVVYTTVLDTGSEPNISTRSSEILAWSQSQVEAIMGIESPFKLTESMESIKVSSADYGIEESFVIDPSVMKRVQHSFESW
jgi:hypothetical protein